MRFWQRKKGWQGCSTEEIASRGLPIYGRFYILPLSPITLTAINLLKGWGNLPMVMVPPDPFSQGNLSLDKWPDLL